MSMGSPQSWRPEGDGPIENLEFSVFSHGAPFHVTVDNVQVAYS